MVLCGEFSLSCRASRGTTRKSPDAPEIMLRGRRKGFHDCYFTSILSSCLMICPSDEMPSMMTE
jgi:hypothetical protein